jgi:hypothetical protein
MQVIRLTETFIEFILPIRNINQLKKLSFCGFRTNNGSFVKGKQTIVPINENSIFIRSNFDEEDLAHLIVNLSEGTSD